MRTSFVSRSVIAVATLGIGSVALAAAPATAALPAGITRDTVLTAAAGVRANPASTNASAPSYGPAANRALRVMVNRVCGLDPDGAEISTGSIAASTAGGGSADGVVVSAVIYNLDTLNGTQTPQVRLCSFGALATTADRSVLTGTAEITGAPASALSGDAFVTGPVNTPVTNGLGNPFATLPTFSATGNAVQSVDVKVKDKKSTKEKKAAKKKYESRLTSAKKSYKKALTKAGGSKSKKAAAKKAYRAKVKSAKAKYRYGIANYKIRTSKIPTPFNVSAHYTPPTNNQP